MDDFFNQLTPEQQREDRKLRTLQRLVDSAGRRVVTGQLNKRQALTLAEETRSSAEAIIPDQMKLYDMIYGSRFRYWIEHFCEDGRDNS
ncbi:hypothetical protein CEE37_04775 [candidate division LCP-89 bacterium B3_LCP]|uniref:Uncharacterized protein n=1 Tax=candidate division LCP-89 bacterium B3_LCP TaxID=2012998 RepID=A0A532V3T9_UNCL8|nr:MAG: hypothetical protein CEE37_04775 [candidate division LCP-89 bacterium B3_LCP]